MATLNFGIISILAITILATSVLGQIGAPCHANIFRITPRHSLNISAFMGSWYAQEYAASDIGNTPEPDFKCLKLDFALPNSDDLLHWDNMETYIDIASGLTQTGNNYVVVNDTRSPLSSVWEVSNEDGSITATTILIAADLEFASWSVVYSCQLRAPDNYRWETATIYTRERQISDELRNFVKALTVGLGFRIGDHKVMSQEGCE